jgi:hypothetical protein
MGGMSGDQIPKAVWSGVFVVCGVELRCSVLDDGRRIIDAEDVHRLIALTAVRKLENREAFDAFMRWYRER